MCRPRQCSSATNWWKLPSVTFSVSSKDSTGFCGGKGVVIPGTPRAPPTAPGPAPYTRPTPWAPPTDAGPPLPKTPPIHLGPALSVRPTPRGPTSSLGLPLRGPRPRSLTRPFLRLPTAPGPGPSSAWELGCRGSTRPADLRRRELGHSFPLQALQLGVDVGQSSLGQSQPLREDGGREEGPAVDAPPPPLLPNPGS